MKPENAQTPEKTIQSLKIDVVAQSVTSVEIPANDTLQNLYKLINCQTVSGFDLDGFHYYYIDDEGLLTQPNGYFTLPFFS